MVDYEPLFSYVESFGSIPEGYKEQLYQIITPMQFNEGDLLIAEGTYNDKLYFIVRGIVRGFYLDESGKEITDWFLREGQLIAPAEGYYFRIPSLDSVQALQECHVLMFTFDDLEKLYRQFPSTERFGRMGSMQYSIYWRTRLKELRATSVANRYKQLLENFPDIVQRVKVQYIASYLNTSRYHLSHIRSQRQ